MCIIFLRQVNNITSVDSNASFRRKLSKREKKQLKKQEKLSRMKSENGDVNENDGVAEKLYNGEINFILRLLLNVQFLFSRIARNVVHQINIESRSCHAKAAATKTRKEIATVQVEGRRTRYRLVFLHVFKN